MSKIGLLTLHNSYNYGAVLQAYATYKFLKDKGNEVTFVNYQNEYERKYNKLFSYRSNLSLKKNIIIFLKNTLFGSFFICNKAFDKFIKKLPKTQKIDSDFLKLNNYKFDYVISGSDQIWNPEIFGGKIDDKYLLNFSTSAKKISYASSMGSYKLSDNEIKVFKECLKYFSSVSVRENFAKEQLVDVIENDISVVCDPTMLISKNEWINIMPKEVKIKEKYILVYLMTKYEEYEDIIIKYAKENNLKVVMVSFSYIKRKGVDYHLRGIDPMEFVSYIYNAQVVMTNSFHAAIFSVILNKELVCLYNKNNPKRIDDLLENFGIKDRLIKEYSDLKGIKNINFDVINEKIQKIMNESEKWLIDATEKIEG